MWINKELFHRVLKDLNDLKSGKIEAVMCEHTKLLGPKDLMVKKTLRLNARRGPSWMARMEPTTTPIYFSPVFAPTWDIKDETGDEVKYFTRVPGQDSEVTVDGTPVVAPVASPTSEANTQN